MKKSISYSVMFILLSMTSLISIINSILVFNGLSSVPTGFLVPITCAKIVMGLVTDGMIASTTVLIILMLILSIMPTLIYFFLAFLAFRGRKQALVISLLFTVADAALFFTNIESLIFNLILKIILIIVSVLALSVKNKD